MSFTNERGASILIIYPSLKLKLLLQFCLKRLMCTQYCMFKVNPRVCIIGAKCSILSVSENAIYIVYMCITIICRRDVQELHGVNFTRFYCVKIKNVRPHGMP